MLGKIAFGEVIYFTRLAVLDDNGYGFQDVALVCAFTLLEEDTLQISYMTVAICEATEAILVVKIRDIFSVVAMIPYTLQDRMNQEEAAQFFVMERLGLDVTDFIVGEALAEDQDENEEGDNIE